MPVAKDRSVELSKKIDELTRKGMTQRQIAAKLHIAPSTVCRYQKLLDTIGHTKEDKKPKSVLSCPEPEPSNYKDFKIDGEGRWLVLGDVHIPFHDRATVEAAIRQAKKENVAGVVLNGDTLDSHEISSHDKDPSAPRYVREIELGNHFLQWVRQELPNARIIFKEGNHECFDDKTECLTDKGWVSHDQLTPESMVASYNISTGIIEYERPLAIHRSEFSGELVHVKSTKCDIAVTPNHRMYYAPNANADWRIRPISDITKGKNRIVVVTSAISGNPEYPMSDAEIAISAWILTDCGITSRPTKSGGETHSVIFYQRPDKVKLITGLLDNLGWTYTRKDRFRDIKEICGKKLLKQVQPSCQLRLNGDSTSKALALVSRRGTIPDWVYKLSDRQFKIFLSSLVDGDGSRHKSNPESSWMIYKPKEFLDQLQIACCTHGYRTSTTEYRTGHWRLNITESLTSELCDLGKITSAMPYSGTVWCVTTKNDTVVVRRNGKIIVTGNSRLGKYIMGRAPALFDLEFVNLRSLLHFSDYGIEEVRDKRVIKIGKLHLIHGHEYNGGGGVNPARWLYLRARSKAACSHFHRTSEHHARDIGQKYEATWSIGCACQLSPAYAPLNEWNHGFAIVELANDGTFAFRNLRVLDGKVL